MTNTFSGRNDGSDVTTEVQAFLEQGGQRIFEAGTYAVNEIAVADITLDLVLKPGAKFVPANAPVDMFTFTNVDLSVHGCLTIDGMATVERGIVMNGGRLCAEKIYAYGLGDPVAVSSGTVAGLWASGVDIINIKSARFTDLNAVGNGVKGDAFGAVRGIHLLNCGPYNIGTFEMSGGNAEEIDAFQSNVGNYGGVIDVFNVEYNHNYRRCGKFQSGDNVIVNAQIRPGADFVAYGADTDVGEKNLNCIDWASSSADGQITVLSGLIDASGYKVGVANSAGQGQNVALSDVVLKGSTRNAIRPNTETGAPEDVPTIGIYLSGGDKGSIVRECFIENFMTGFYTIGNNSTANSNLFIDPRSIAAQIGWTSETRGHDFSRNKVLSRTSGALNGSYVIVLGDIKESRVDYNMFREDGNTTHSSVFIKASNVSAVVQNTGNIATAGMDAFNG